MVDVSNTVKGTTGMVDDTVKGVAGSAKQQQPRRQPERSGRRGERSPYRRSRSPPRRRADADRERDRDRDRHYDRDRDSRRRRRESDRSRRTYRRNVRSEVDATPISAGRRHVPGKLQPSDPYDGVADNESETHIIDRAIQRTNAIAEAEGKTLVIAIWRFSSSRSCRPVLHQTPGA